MMGGDQPRRRASASRKSYGPTRWEFPDTTNPPPTIGTTTVNFSIRQWCAKIALGVVIAILCLFTIWYALTGQWMKPHSDFADFLTGHSDNVTGQNILGIMLHSEDHVSRDPGVVNLHWTITSAFRAPDGVKKRVYLINGEFPGPTVEVRSGDTLVVHVENALITNDEGVSIHWHGLNMHGFNDMDGAVGFTQCPIPPGSSMTYEFHIDDDQHGTFWYHAHSQVQRGDGLYGGLVIHRPNGGKILGQQRHQYEKDVLLLIGDWYHRPAEDILTWYTSVEAFGNEPVPDSLVVNGVGAFNCSMAVPARPIECHQVSKRSLPSMFGNDLFPTRLRVVNVGSIAGISLGISNAHLTPLQVDGGFEIVGTTADNVGILYPGERVDLIVRWDEIISLKGSDLEIIMDPENFKYPNPSLTPNQSFPIISSHSRLETTSSATQTKDVLHFDLQSAVSATQESISAEADQTIIIYTKTLKLAIYENHPMGFINRTSWRPQVTPLLSLTRKEWDEHQLIPWIPIPAASPNNRSRSSTWVDIIINNLDDGSHPFHIHGHSFYVIATYKSDFGWGSYVPQSDAGNALIPDFNLVNPLRKDTVMVPRRGFVVLRFRADNVGIWMLHCHVLVHQASGMAMGLQVGGDESHAIVNEGASRLCRV